MKKNRFLLAILSILIYHNSNAQFYPYYLGDPYSNTIVFGNIYTIQKPKESYQSLRMRTFSEGSLGLIRDNYSDHFRNPAYLIEGNRNEIFGDLGSIQDYGKFILGGSLPIADKSLGISINLEGMRKNKSTNTYENYYSLAGGFTDTYTTENSPRRYGTRLSFSSPINSEVTAGASYHFLKSDEIYRSSWRNRNFDSLYFYDELRSTDYSKIGTNHKIDVGTLINYKTFVLDLKTTLLFSSYKPKNQDETIYRSTSSTEYRARFKPTDIDSRGGLISAVLNFTSPNSKDHLRFLAQSAYTAYNIKGKTNLLDTVSYSSGTAYKYITDGTREGDGYVFDIRSGFGYERFFSETLVAYAAISVNYILHKTNISENKNSINTGSLTTTTNISTTPSEKLESIDIRLPIAIEYFHGDYVILRGGVEPRYRTFETIKSFIESRIYDNSLSNFNYKFIKELNELSITSNFGATLRHNEYGAVDLLFGNILTDTKFWSIALRVFL